MLTSPRMQEGGRRKKLLEWVQVKLNQTQNRLQLLRLHVNGSQIRQVSKRCVSRALKYKLDLHVKQTEAPVDNFIH